MHAVQPRDIPVPAGMELKTYNHASNTLEVGEYRYADLVYEGETPAIQVASYLLQRMPQHSYRLVSDERIAKDHLKYVFERGPYRTECIIRGLEFWTRLEIRLRTHPKL